MLSFLENIQSGDDASLEKSMELLSNLFPDIDAHLIHKLRNVIIQRDPWHNVKNFQRDFKKLWKKKNLKVLKLRKDDIIKQLWDCMAKCENSEIKLKVKYECHLQAFTVYY